MVADFRIEPLDGVTFGAWVRDIDVRTLTEESTEALHAAWLEHALLIFPDQFLSRDEQDTFARRFGELEFTAAAISNVTVDADGVERVHHEPDDDLVKSLVGNQGWHHDSTYMPVQAKGAVFSAETVPVSGADTAWADMRAAFDALDDDTRAFLSDKSAHHSLYWSQGRNGLLPTPRDDGSYAMYGYHDHEVSLRPLTKVHPETGRTNLLAGRHAHNIVGMDPDESLRFLDALDEQACQAPRIYQHQWTEGEVVLWDNRCLMHKGVPWVMTEPRRMWHTRIAGEAASEAALNHR